MHTLTRTIGEWFIPSCNKEGRHYPIIELSQATKEQAYIALRLSLASAKGKSAPFPLLLDDPFVHFDEETIFTYDENNGTIKYESPVHLLHMS